MNIKAQSNIGRERMLASKSSFSAYVVRLSLPLAKTFPA